MANVTGWYAEVSSGVTAPRMAATALMKPPSVDSVSPFVIAPQRMSATAVLKTPVLGFSTTLTSPRMAATAAMAVPTVSNFLNAAVTAPRMEAAAALPVPVVGVSGNIASPRMAATAALATPVVTTINGSTFSDTFNRADSGTLGASWNTNAIFATSLSISSNAAAGTFAANIYATPMATGDNEVTVVMKGTPAAGSKAIIGARSDSATDSSAATQAVQLAMSQNDKWSLFRYSDDSGVPTAANQSWADGDTIVFSCVGGTLTVKRNGSTVLTTSGATDLAAGYVSLLVVSAGAAFGFDSFTAQDI